MELCPHCNVWLNPSTLDSDHVEQIRNGTHLTLCKTSGDVFALAWQRTVNSFNREHSGLPSIVNDDEEENKEDSKVCRICRLNPCDCYNENAGYGGWGGPW